jgi:hypothetical protein
MESFKELLAAGQHPELWCVTNSQRLTADNSADFQPIRENHQREESVKYLASSSALSRSFSQEQCVPFLLPVADLEKSKTSSHGSSDCTSKIVSFFFAELVWKLERTAP